MAAIESSAKKATVFRNAPEVVATLVEREPCFNSCNHPRGDLFAHMARELLRALGGDALVVEAAAPLRKLATANATDFDVRHPVPCGISQHLASIGVHITRRGLRAARRWNGEISRPRTQNSRALWQAFLKAGS